MNSLQRAQKHWGDDMPEWVSTLAVACDNSSQKRIADQLNYSPSVVNQVLGNKYIGGDLSAVQQAVEGLLMAHTVHCPVLDEMRADICLQHQKREFKATNHIRIRLYKACRSGCPHSRIGGHQ